MGILAQSDSGMASVFIWGIILIGLLVAGFFAVSLVRRYLKEDDAVGTPGGGGFTLSDLRELHAAGKLTTEEFEKAKYAMVEGMKRATAAAEARKAEERKNAAQRIIDGP